jgi:hypothetical protein
MIAKRDLQIKKLDEIPVSITQITTNSFKHFQTGM